MSWLNKLFIMLPFAALSIPAVADSSNQAEENYTELSLEQLLTVKVTSAAKKSQSVLETANAVSVITQEDLHRLGIKHLPDALRLVPGVQVAQISANRWAISARGFNDTFANKLLVLVDGRSVYTTLFSGVYWVIQDTMIEDIDRIEVIRGPGAALWGANAVNGIINIITKTAKDTQGGLLSATVSNHEQGIVSLRQGGKIGDNTYYRVSAKYSRHDGFPDVKNHLLADDWQMKRVNWRMDGEPSTQSTWSIISDLYTGKVGEEIRLTLPTTRTFRGEATMRGASLLARWQQKVNEDNQWQLQTYYGFAQRNGNESILQSRDAVADVDFNHQWQATKNQDIIWGVGIRYSQDNFQNSSSVAVTPTQRRAYLFNLFVQDDITLIPQYLRLTIGSKLEHHDYTGLEFQPNIRLLWTPTPHHILWSAVSRAVRTPSRIERSATTRFGAPGVNFTLLGNPTFQSETLTAYEAGYRTQFFNNISIDVSTFYNDYNKLLAIETLGFNRVSRTVNLTLSNQMYGEVYGAEIATQWRVREWWRLSAAYTYLQVQLHLRPTSNDTRSQGGEGDSPHHQGYLRSSINIGKAIDLDASLFYADKLPNQQVPAYTRVDFNLGWHLSSSVSVDMGVQNLLDKRHPEFGSASGVVATEIERTFYGQIRWQF